MIDIPSISRFLIALGKVAYEAEKFEFGRSVEVLSSFLPKMADFREGLASARKSETPDFNLFKIMRVDHYEAWLHTPVLVNLLNPKGTHAQGHLFYHHFIGEALHPMDPLKKNFMEGDVLKIVGEHHTRSSLGILDIWIEVMHNGNQYCMIIENKVYANDQYHQMLRYYEYACQRGYAESRIRLLYLAPWPGRWPTAASMDSSMQDRLIEERILQAISYRHTISTFLQRSIQNLEASRLRSSIQQYLEVVSNL